MKRSGLSVAAVALVLALGAMWFFATHDLVDTKVSVGPSPQARANPYLAAMRFIERLGGKAALLEHPRMLDSLTGAGVPATLVLLAGRVTVTPERAQALIRWADNGGHLIIEPEPFKTRDHVLDALGIARRGVEQRIRAQTMQVELPGSQAELTVSAGGTVVLDAANAPVDFVATDPAGVRLASWRRAGGRITAITGMARFQNRAIGLHDNAELLRRIIALGPPASAVHWLRPDADQPLVAWIEAHALVPLGVATVLLLAWLWARVPRFGPVQPYIEVDRRQLLEHIRASGRFRWASGARAALLDAARERCREHATTQKPQLAHATPAERYRVLAEELGTPAAQIAHAFEGTPVSSRDFVHIVATLASIHRRVSRIDRGVPARKRQQ